MYYTLYHGDSRIRTLAETGLNYPRELPENLGIVIDQEELGILTKYLRYENGIIVEMTQTEKDIVDAQINEQGE